MKNSLCSLVNRMPAVAVVGCAAAVEEIKDVVKTVFVIRADAVVKGRNIIHLHDVEYLKTVKANALVVATAHQQTLVQLQDIIYQYRPLIVFTGSELSEAVKSCLHGCKYREIAHDHFSIWKSK